MAEKNGGGSPSKPASIADNVPQRTEPHGGGSSSGGSSSGAAPPARAGVQPKRGQAVFDEVEDLDENYVLPVIAKSDEVLARLSEATADNTLFVGVAEAREHLVRLGDDG